MPAVASPGGKPQHFQAQTLLANPLFPDNFVSSTASSFASHDRSFFCTWAGCAVHVLDFSGSRKGVIHTMAPVTDCREGLWANDVVIVVSYANQIDVYDPLSCERLLSVILPSSERVSAVITVPPTKRVACNADFACIIGTERGLGFLAETNLSANRSQTLHYQPWSKDASAAEKGHILVFRIFSKPSCGRVGDFMLSKCDSRVFLTFGEGFLGYFSLSSGEVKIEPESHWIHDAKMFPAGQHLWLAEGTGVLSLFRETRNGFERVGKTSLYQDIVAVQTIPTSSSGKTAAVVLVRGGSGTSRGASKAYARPYEAGWAALVVSSGEEGDRSLYTLAQCDGPVSPTGLPYILLAASVSQDPLKDVLERGTRLTLLACSVRAAEGHSVSGQPESVSGAGGRQPAHAAAGPVSGWILSVQLLKGNPIGVTAKMLRADVMSAYAECVRCGAISKRREETMRAAEGAGQSSLAWKDVASALLEAAHERVLVEFIRKGPAPARALACLFDWAKGALKKLRTEGDCCIQDALNAKEVAPSHNGIRASVKDRLLSLQRRATGLAEVLRALCDCGDGTTEGARPLSTAHAQALCEVSFTTSAYWLADSNLLNPRLQGATETLSSVVQATGPPRPPTIFRFLSACLVSSPSQPCDAAPTSAAASEVRYPPEHVEDGLEWLRCVSCPASTATSLLLYWLKHAAAEAPSEVDADAVDRFGQCVGLREGLRQFLGAVSRIDFPKTLHDLRTACDVLLQCGAPASSQLYVMVLTAVDSSACHLSQRDNETPSIPPSLRLLSSMDPTSPWLLRAAQPATGAHYEEHMAHCFRVKADILLRGGCLEETLYWLRTERSAVDARAHEAGLTTHVIDQTFECVLEWAYEARVIPRLFSSLFSRAEEQLVVSWLQNVDEDLAIPSLVIFHLERGQYAEAFSLYSEHESTTLAEDTVLHDIMQTYRRSLPEGILRSRTLIARPGNVCLTLSGDDDEHGSPVKDFDGLGLASSGDERHHTHGDNAGMETDGDTFAAGPRTSGGWGHMFSSGPSASSSTINFGLLRHPTAGGSLGVDGGMAAPGRAGADHQLSTPELARAKQRDIMLSGPNESHSHHHGHGDVGPGFRLHENRLYAHHSPVTPSSVGRNRTTAHAISPLTPETGNFFATGSAWRR